MEGENDKEKKSSPIPNTMLLTSPLSLDEKKVATACGIITADYLLRTLIL